MDGIRGIRTMDVCDSSSMLLIHVCSGHKDSGKKYIFYSLPTRVPKTKWKQWKWRKEAFEELMWCVAVVISRLIRHPLVLLQYT